MLCVEVGGGGEWGSKTRTQAGTKIAKIGGKRSLLKAGL